MKIGWFEAPNPAGVYHSRAYGEAACLSAHSAWNVIGDEEGLWRVPLGTMSPSPGYLDAFSPYGYPGIHASASLSANQIAEAWRHTRDVLLDRNVVSALFRFAPYRESLEGWHHELEGLETALLSETIGVALGDEATMWGAMEGRSRTAIRKAEKEGMTVLVLEADDTLVSAGSDFRRLYDQTMERVGASPQHRHADNYYQTLVGGLGSAVRVAKVFDEDGQVIAACLLLVDIDGVHYHLSGSLPEAARLGANNLMIWSAMKWAAANGHRLMHLGGGTSKGDSLFRFKASFGGRSLPYYIGRLILRPDEYRRLVGQQALSLGIAEDELTASGFFPAYRAVPPRRGPTT